MTIEEKIEITKKFIPEIQDYDIEIVKKLYEIAEKRHPEEHEEMLRIYLFGYLLTNGEDLEFEEIQISNVILKEVESYPNPYLKMYKILLETLSDSNVPTVSII